MPELPDITVYVECLRARVSAQTLDGLRIAHPFALRTFDPPTEASFGQTVVGVSRLGKRIVISLSGGLHWVVHLMVAGRLQWVARNARISRRGQLVAFDFDCGTLVLSEAGTTRRASLHLVRGDAELDTFRRLGVEPLECDCDRFVTSLRRENHTLKRALTDPDIVSGIGNAYSDEILHAARLSPVARTQRLDTDSCERLYMACRSTLEYWTDNIRRETGSTFPRHVTAYRLGMAVHGRYRQPCPTCQTKVQRIRYAKNECNYCPTCQTGGRLLADRGLSRLLRQDWPRSLEELDEHIAMRRSVAAKSQGLRLG